MECKAVSGKQQQSASNLYFNFCISIMCWAKSSFVLSPIIRCQRNILHPASNDKLWTLCHENYTNQAISSPYSIKKNLLIIVTVVLMQNMCDWKNNQMWGPLLFPFSWSLLLANMYSSSVIDKKIICHIMVPKRCCIIRACMHLLPVNVPGTGTCNLRDVQLHYFVS